jgi:hypothetical protein
VLWAVVSGRNLHPTVHMATETPTITTTRPRRPTLRHKSHITAATARQVNKNNCPLTHMTRIPIIRVIAICNWTDSLSMPSYTRHQRYVHPDYLGENMQIAQGSSLHNYACEWGRRRRLNHIDSHSCFLFPAPYTISDSSAEPFPSASHHSYGHSTGSSHGSGSVSRNTIHES